MIGCKGSQGEELEMHLGKCASGRDPGTIPTHHLKVFSKPRVQKVLLGGLVQSKWETGPQAFRSGVLREHLPAPCISNKPPGITSDIFWKGMWRSLRIRVLSSHSAIKTPLPRGFCLSKQSLEITKVVSPFPVTYRIMEAQRGWVIAQGHRAS